LPEVTVIILALSEDFPRETSPEAPPDFEDEEVLDEPAAADPSCLRFIISRNFSAWSSITNSFYAISI